MSILYLAHPYNGKSGTEEEARKNINSASNYCILLNKCIMKYSLNYSIISPLHNFSYLTVKDCQKNIMFHCIRLLDICNALLVCPGYENSKGCMEELQYAKDEEKTIYYLRIINEKIEISKDENFNEIIELYEEKIR